VHIPCSTALLFIRISNTCYDIVNNEVTAIRKAILRLLVNPVNRKVEIQNRRNGNSEDACITVM
jgi:hypothetical protein